MAKLMIVEDDAVMSSLLKTLLELDGFEVIQPKSMIGIADLLMSNQPDLLLMDVFLKDLDGIELLKQIRTIPALSSLPVVMTSGLEVSHRCMAAGANAFVQKPYEPDWLIQIIREQLQQSGNPT